MKTKNITKKEAEKLGWTITQTSGGAWHARHLGRSFAAERGEEHPDFCTTGHALTYNTIMKRITNIEKLRNEKAN